MDLTPNRKKKAATRGLSIRAAAKEARRLKLPRLHVTSINQDLQLIWSVFDWCRKADYKRAVTSNPFDGMTLKKKTKARHDRDPFTPGELTAIFTAPVFTGCVSERDWKTPGPTVLRDSPKFWIPLIGLFTGMRSNEICKLRPADIKNEDGVDFIDVAKVEFDDSDIDGGVKTAAGERRIPVHPILVEIGFLTFVERVRRAERERLFPSLKADSYGSFSNDWGKHFRNRLKVAAIKHKKNCFHSFRHTVEDASRNSGIAENAMNYMQGHEQTGQGARYGNGHLDLELLAREVPKLRYKGLDLSHLKVT
jgi:integrase